MAFFFSFSLSNSLALNRVGKLSETNNSDAWKRLTKITYPDGNITEYTYDTAGNRTAVANNNGTTVYTYGSDNQLLTVTRPDGTTVNYAYNSNGDVVEITDGSGTTKFDYDGEGRLVTVTLPDNSTVTFAYDAEGHRVSKTTSAGTVKYVYDGDRLVAETDDSGNIIATYVFDDSDMPVSMHRGGVTYYYLYDGHGDVIALIDQAGNIAATYEYDEWGNVIAETGQVENPFRYAGYIYDEELKLYFLKSRYYDPSAGRFLSKDKAQGVDENPYNKYKYCNDDPVNFVDPSGYNFAPVGEFPSRSWFDGIPYKWRRDAIARLQNDLNAWGYLGGNGLRLVVDGIYGPNTRFAHESYFLARYTIAFFGYNYFPTVATLQRLLASKGFDPGPIDGLYGPKTRIANEHYLDSIGKTPAALTRISAKWVPTYVDRTNEVMNLFRRLGEFTSTYVKNVYGVRPLPGNLRYVEYLGTFACIALSIDPKRDKEWVSYGKFRFRIYNFDLIWTAEDVGNAAYGYYGKAYGLTETELLLGTHLNELRQKLKLDDENDIKAIKVGFKVFDFDFKKNF